MFTYRVRVISTNEYLTILVNTNLTRLLNGSGFLNPRMTCLLNGSVMLTRLLPIKKKMLTHLLDFIKAKQNTNFSINPIDLNYEKQNK